MEQSDDIDDCSRYHLRDNLTAKFPRGEASASSLQIHPSIVFFYMMKSMCYRQLIFHSWPQQGRKKGKWKMEVMTWVWQKLPGLSPESDNT